jgi:endonuclease/exonuclease/phosphatase (EEP) superfamily protein YafD
MTANLWSERVDAAALGQLIDEVAPDVLAVQELEAHAVAAIAARFPHSFLDPAIEAVGSGVATRLPAGAARLAMPHRDGWILTVTPPGWSHPIEIVAVHLMNPIRWPWLASGSIRRRQVGAVVSHVRSTTGPVLVVGDLNATPAWPAYRRLRASGLADGARLAGTAGPTWRYHGIGPPMLRIDHALTRGLTVASTRTVVIPGSDHLGLVVEVAPPAP